MTATFPARPGTALDATSLTGTLIQNTAAAGGKFYLKVTSATFSASMPLVETTGSGDATVMYSHGDKPYYDITLQGVMLATKGVGLQNLTQQIDANGAPVVKVSFKFSGVDSAPTDAAAVHAFQDLPVIITQCQIQFDPKLPVVGVSLAMKSMAKANQGLEGGTIT